MRARLGPVHAARQSPRDRRGPLALTQDRDLGSRWQADRSLPSLRHYVPASTEARRVDLYTLEGDGDVWRLTSHGPALGLPLCALSVELPIPALYEGTEIAA